MKPTSDSGQRSLWLMLLSIVAFAANVLLLRGLALRVPEVDGYQASVVRGVVGFLIVIVGFRGRGFEPGNLVRRPMVLLRGTVGAVAILLFYVTVVHLGAGRAVIINLTYTIFGALMAARWLGERLNIRQLAWMVAGLVGLALFLAGDMRSGGITRYEFLGVLGAVTAGLAVVLIRILRHSEHSSTIYASQCVWSALAALPFCTGPLPALTGPAIPVLGLAAILVSVGQLAMTEAFRTMSVARGSALQMLMPVLTGAGGVLLFDERYRLLELAGGAVTLLATWRAVRSE